MKLINSIFSLFLNFFINIFKGFYLLFKNPGNFIFILVGIIFVTIVTLKTDINPTVRFLVFWLAIPASLNIICKFDTGSIKNKTDSIVYPLKSKNEDFSNNYELSNMVTHIERKTITTKEVKEIIYFKGDN